MSIFLLPLVTEAFRLCSCVNVKLNRRPEPSSRWAASVRQRKCSFVLTNRFCMNCSQTFSNFCHKIPPKIHQCDAFFMQTDPEFFSVSMDTGATHPTKNLTFIPNRSQFSLKIASISENVQKKKAMDVLLNMFRDRSNAMSARFNHYFRKLF